MTEIFEEAEEFIRRPFTVKAVHVMMENIHEISELIGTLVAPTDEGEDFLPYIEVDPAKVRNRTRCRIGQWVTAKAGEGGELEFQIFGADGFDNQFYPADEQVMNWVTWLAKQGRKE